MSLKRNLSKSFMVIFLFFALFDTFSSFYSNEKVWLGKLRKINELRQ